MPAKIQNHANFSPKIVTLHSLSINPICWQSPEKETLNRTQPKCKQNESFKSKNTTVLKFVSKDAHIFIIFNYIKLV